MIVWLNGAFGAGKSTCAELLRDALPGARLFDPEYVGFLLRRFVDTPTGDFQDLRLWRTLTVETLAGLAAEHGGTWVVPMTVLDPGYRAEILGGLRGRGLAVRQVVLVLPEDVLRARIDRDPTLPADATAWRHEHVEAALSALSNLAAREPDTREVDAAQPPGQVVRDVLAWLSGRERPAPAG